MVIVTSLVLAALSSFVSGSTRLPRRSIAGCCAISMSRGDLARKARARSQTRGSGGVAARSAKIFFCFKVASEGNYFRAPTEQSVIEAAGQGRLSERGSADGRLQGRVFRSSSLRHE